MRCGKHGRVLGSRSHGSGDIAKNKGGVKEEQCLEDRTLGNRTVKRQPEEQEPHNLQRGRRRRG